MSPGGVQQDRGPLKRSEPPARLTPQCDPDCSKLTTALKLRRPLTFVAREAHDKACTAPRLDGLSVRVPDGFSHGCLVVLALDRVRRPSDTAIVGNDVDAVVRMAGWSSWVEILLLIFLFHQIRRIFHPITDRGPAPGVGG